MKDDILIEALEAELLDGPLDGPVSPAVEVPRGLVYVTDAMPGIRRMRRGKGFSYLAPDGTTIERGPERERLEKLGVPPAYENVWMCPLPHGHLQATGLQQCLVHARNIFAPNSVEKCSFFAGTQLSMAPRTRVTTLPPTQMSLPSSWIRTRPARPT